MADTGRLQVKWAVYDLSKNSPSFDFMNFMQPALENGCTGVWLRDGLDPMKQVYGEAEKQELRVQNIILPIIKLYGLELHRTDKPPAQKLEVVWPGKNVTPGEAHLFGWSVRMDKPYPLMPSQEALDRANDRMKGQRKMTVSLREYHYDKPRNSGEDWRRWALDHDAILIEDAFKVPITIDDRLALYELASLNLGVAAGHTSLQYFSYRPCLVFKWIVEGSKVASVSYQEKRVGWKFGSQFKWSGKKQKLLWHGKDFYSTIEHEYQTYLKEAT